MTSTSQPTLFSPPLPQPPIAASPTAIRQQLRQWMETCRHLTLDLFVDLDRDTLCQQAHPDFSPVGWHLGHIGYTEALWLLERCAGQPPQWPEYRRLFAADILPKRDRQQLPALTDIYAYLAQVRSQVFAYLETAPIQDQAWLWRWLLQHESQHCETITFILALHRQATVSPIAPACAASPPLPTPMLEVPAGQFCMGNTALDALDNERDQHWVDLPTYWIDRTPVTQGQYQQFIAAGGYDDPQWWTPEGWDWRRSHSVTHPLYWSDPVHQAEHPVCGVSWYETAAYAKFVGKRLPTEAEWEKAARWKPETTDSLTYPWGDSWPTSDHCNCSHWVGQTTPVDAYPRGISPVGCLDMLGNVWEWTDTWFDRYPGFQPYPYPGYSQVYFDDEHRVLRGGSWATRPWAFRAAFRNWYHPHTREIFAGFRCVSDRPLGAQ